MFGSTGLPEITIAIVVGLMLAVVVWPAMRIAERLGLPRWLGLLVVVPVANLVLLWFVALTPWPARAEH